MHDLPRKKLAETIRKDRSLCHDHELLQGDLADSCGGGYRTERIVLVAAAQEGIPKDLTSTPTGVPKVLLISRLTVKLAENRGLSEDNARWAVESWALALETVTEKELEEISAPSGGPPTTPTGVHPLDPFSKPALSPEDQMRSAIVEALRDGEVTDLEKMGLESLRLTLGASRDTASRLFKEVADEMGIQPEGAAPAEAEKPGAGRPPSTETAMYGANPQRTGEYPGPGVPVLHGVKWKFKTGDAVWSSPCVSEGVVYFGSDDNCLYAIDAETGREEWSFKTGDRAYSSPCVSRGIVFVGSVDHFLYAIDAESGREKWKFETGDRVQSSPCVSGGTVFVGSGDRFLYAIDAETGRERWKFETGGEVNSSPCVSGGVLYFGSNDRHLYALDASMGREKWKFETGGEVNSSPCVSEEVVYFGSCDNCLYALDVAFGDEVWRTSLDSEYCPNSPSVTGAVVLCGCEKGYLYALDNSTGSEKWRFEAIDAFESSPTIEDGMVFIGNVDGNMYALDVLTGKEIWRFEAYEIYSTPCIAGGMIYFGSIDGHLYALY